jgi:pSer/pThr/pTyr-binding forkhead associated (FHA) protein
VEPVAFVELLDRRGRVRSRIKLWRLPATVGRGYGNDVIVDDPYVCPEHVCLSLAEDGTFVADDLGSVNGTRRSGDGERRQRIPLEGDTVLRIGRTLLRVRDPRQHLAPTRPDPGTVDRVAPRYRVSTLLTVVALAAAILSLDQYLARFDKLVPAELASETGFALLGIAFWAGAWAVINRIVGHEYRFLAHCAIASVVAVAYTILGWVSDAVVFVVSPDRMPTLLPLALWALLVGVLLSSHISLFSSMSRWRRTSASILAAVAILGVFHLRRAAVDTGFSNALEFPGEIAPISTRWLRTVDPDAYFEQVAALRHAVDALAAEQEDPS